MGDFRASGQSGIYWYLLVAVGWWLAAIVRRHCHCFLHAADAKLGHTHASTSVYPSHTVMLPTPLATPSRLHQCQYRRHRLVLVEHIGAARSRAVGGAPLYVWFMCVYVMPHPELQHRQWVRHR